MSFTAVFLFRMKRAALVASGSALCACATLLGLDQPLPVRDGGTNVSDGSADVILNADATVLRDAASDGSLLADALSPDTGSEFVCPQAGWSYCNNFSVAFVVDGPWTQTATNSPVPVWSDTVGASKPGALQLIAYKNDFNSLQYQPSATTTAFAFKLEQPFVDNEILASIEHMNCNLRVVRTSEGSITLRHSSSPVSPVLLFNEVQWHRLYIESAANAFIYQLDQAPQVTMPIMGSCTGSPRVRLGPETQAAATRSMLIDDVLIR
jgi:hypothetical protein